MTPRDLAVGATLPPRAYGPVTRTTLALFAGASGDHNAVHIDVEAARAAGFDDVFAHGMLSMAYLASYVTDVWPQSTVRRLSARFVARTPVDARPICSGRVVAGADGQLTVDLEVRLEDGTTTLVGSALVAVR